MSAAFVRPPPVMFKGARRAPGNGHEARELPPGDARSLHAVSLELDHAQPRRPLPDRRLGPTEPVSELAETLATAFVVERRGEPDRLARRRDERCEVRWAWWAERDTDGPCSSGPSRWTCAMTTRAPRRRPRGVGASSAASTRRSARRAASGTRTGCCRRACAPRRGPRPPGRGAGPGAALRLRPPGRQGPHPPDQVDLVARRQADRADRAAVPARRQVVVIDARPVFGPCVPRRPAPAYVRTLVPQGPVGAARPRRRQPRRRQPRRRQPRRHRPGCRGGPRARARRAFLQGRMHPERPPAGPGVRRAAPALVGAGSLTARKGVAQGNSDRSRGRPPGTSCFWLSACWNWT